MNIRKSLLFLILSFILVFSVTYHLEKAHAIDEVVDNYTDETKVAGKHQVVRNATYDAMELDYVIGVGFDVPMDIWTTGGFTEVDPGGNNLKNINGTEIWFDNVDRDEGDRIYKDFGANYFDISFQYLFRFKISLFRLSNPRCYFMAFSEDSDCIYTSSLINGKNMVGFYIQWRQATAKWEVQLRMYNGAVWEIDINTEDQQFDLNKWYHVLYVRNGDNTTAWLYNDASMTDLDFMLTVDNSEVDNLRYFHPLDAEDRDTGDRAMDMWLNRVQNYTAIAGYYNDGHFYTTDVLDGISYNATAVLLNSTIPGGDSLTVEFSQDNSTWILNDWEPIFGGYEAIDLRDLGYSTMYLRFNLTDGGADSTPRLYQLRLIHEAPDADGVAEPDYTPYIALGIILLLFGLVIGSRVKR